MYGHFTLASLASTTQIEFQYWPQSFIANMYQRPESCSSLLEPTVKLLSGHLGPFVSQISRRGSQKVYQIELVQRQSLRSLATLIPFRTAIRCQLVLTISMNDPLWTGTRLRTWLSLDSRAGSNLNGFERRELPSNHEPSRFLSWD